MVLSVAFFFTAGC
uniref:Uncharacterized protein n=1 Tax=Anguilla anguilla TaxID=7936 RepID=A0A0E9T036_ANGAN